MSYRKKPNVLDPRGNAIDRRLLDKGVPETRRVVKIVRRIETEPVGIEDVPETPTGALEVFSADEFAYDAGILGRNIKRKIFG